MLDLFLISRESSGVLARTALAKLTLHSYDFGVEIQVMQVYSFNSGMAFCRDELRTRVRMLPGQPRSYEVRTHQPERKSRSQNYYG